MGDLTIEKVSGGVFFVVKIVPGSSRTSICGLLDGMLKVKISAVAQKGQANRCLIEFLAKQLGVKKKVISIVSGKTNPVKGMEVLGISAEMLLKKLNPSKLRS